MSSFSINELIALISVVIIFHALVSFTLSVYGFRICILLQIYANIMCKSMVKQSVPSVLCVLVYMSVRAQYYLVHS